MPRSQGVLRSYSIMEKFKGSAKPQNGEKCPLLMYCKALLEAAAVYKPLSVEESLVCAECIIQQGWPCDLMYHFMNSCAFIYLLFQRWMVLVDLLTGLNKELYANHLHYTRRCIQYNPWFTSQLPTSTQLGKLIYSQCKCSKRHDLHFCNVVH